jgi:parallel beta-helix repeat protein
MKHKLLLASFLALALVLIAVSAAVPVSADPATLYVDDDAGGCGGNSPCYQHPQDAVNAASQGDTILVYPGTYGTRDIVCNPEHPEWCQPHDNLSPALIVYKDDLIIRAVDPDPAGTIIQSTHLYWSNAIAVQNSTAGAITGVSGWSPNAVTIVADNVTIEGFTLHRPYDGTFATRNTAGVLIGSRASGAPDYLGQADGATVTGNVFSDVWHAVYVWHSSDNQITNNTVTNLMNTGHWAAISTYDGDMDAQVNLGPPSENNLIAHNSLANKGISLGAWPPDIWTSNAGSQVCSNTTTQVGVAYAHGPVIIGCNTGVFWHAYTDNVLRITGISGTSDTGAFPVGTAVNLGAQLAYDGSADGSGVEVVFIVNGVDYAVATTVAGGLAGTTTTLPAGTYEVQARVTVCGDCVFTTETQIITIFDPAAGSVTGGGWIWSPAGSCQISDICGNGEGQAAFSVNARYSPSSGMPSGVTTYEITAGGFRFLAKDYDSLVVDPVNHTAFLTGSGQINGGPAPNGTAFKFSVQVTDGGQGGADTFWIQIWYEDNGSQIPVYDNGPGLPIGGGNIAIHD